MDAKAHRAERWLEVRAVHLERWLASGGPPPVAGRDRVDVEAALGGLAEALTSLATFVGAARVVLGRVVPGRLRPALARALRATPPPTAPTPDWSHRPGV